jgi:transcription elongation factor GreA
MTDTTTDIFITKEGLDKLKAEYEELVNVKRPDVAKRIKAAREMGDISENAEYDAARQAQSFIEGRISELEEIIKNSKVSDPKMNGKGEVYVGAKVRVKVDGDEEEFHIVGAPEANPVERKISHESPLGSQLLGKKIGEKIEVEAPIGKLIYTILHIE